MTMLSLYGVLSQVNLANIFWVDQENGYVIQDNNVYRISKLFFPINTGKPSRETFFGRETDQYGTDWWVVLTSNFSTNLYRHGCPVAETWDMYRYNHFCNICNTPMETRLTMICDECLTQQYEAEEENNHGYHDDQEENDVCDCGRMLQTASERRDGWCSACDYDADITSNCECCGTEMSSSTSTICGVCYRLEMEDCTICGKHTFPNWVYDKPYCDEHKMGDAPTIDKSPNQPNGLEPTIK